MYAFSVLLFGFGMFWIVFFAYHFFKYCNPYKLFMVFGKKGSGKTTLMCKMALKYRKKGWHVYSNVHIPGTYHFDTVDIGVAHFPENSILLIDEVGLVWDNRNFKSFPEHVKVYFKYQRQYKHIVYLFSQSFDVDKKIRDLTDHLYIIHNFLNCFSVARRITKTVAVVHADKSASGESKIVDDYNIDSLLLAPFGSVRFTYIPKYVKYFNSYNPPLLPEKEFEYMPFPELVKQGKLGALRRAMAGGRVQLHEVVRKWNRKKR